MILIYMMKLLFSVILCLAAGVIGSFFTRSSLETWYSGIKKPSFNPPPWVFAPVWTMLYILMGIAVFLIWQKGLNNEKIRIALLVFLVQLALNTLWSPAFFGMRSPLAGLIIIIMLWIAILSTIMSFYGISYLAAVLLLPYIAWVTFALILNAAIFYLNLR